MLRHRRSQLAAALVLGGALLPAIVLADYTGPASMNGSEEVPSNASTAKATGTVKLLNSLRLPDTGIQDSLVVNITYSGLSGTGITASHIHGYTGRGVNAGVIIGFNSPSEFTAGTTSGTITAIRIITADQAAKIHEGNTYLNIHSNIFPGGEIRGQIDSLVATGSKVPGSSTPGLIMLTLALTGFGILYLRRRRAAA